MKELNNFTRQEIIDYANQVFSDKFSNYGYPVFPVDENGMIDYSDDVGCVPWVICKEFEIVSTEIDDEESKDNEIAVAITAKLTWDDSNEEEKIEEEAEFLIYVYTDSSNLIYGEFKRAN